ncbi:LmeA family phospholipid-binding protein [Nostoc sp.]|uniref:LmeA family phospholipid-binding protein n=1 Tax=Nostoc sp. TaxID=1180 RepID=UPI002FFA61FD
MPDEHRLEEKFLSQEAERRISEKLDEAEKIEIDVQTDLLKIAQGQADGVSVAGLGLVIQEDIRIQEIKLQTDSISINPFSALFGQIELNEPVNAIARIILTEVDINRTLASDFVRSRMQNFDFDVDGEIVSFEPEEIQVFLPGDGKIECKGKVLLKEMGNTRLLAYTAIARPRTHSQPAMLESFNCTEGGGISIELVTAFMQKAKELMNMPYLKWEDMAFNIKEIKVEKGSLILLVETQLKQIPSSLTELSP